MIIAVDFDGTLVQHRFPRIGDPLPGAFETLRDLKAAGHKLILWTCREDEGYKIDKQYLSDAVKFCQEMGVEFDAVNETIAEEEFRPEGQRRKPYAHYYIDDAIPYGFPGWQKIREFFCLDETPNLSEETVS